MTKHRRRVLALFLLIFTFLVHSLLFDYWQDKNYHAAQTNKANSKIMAPAECVHLIYNSNQTQPEPNCELIRADDKEEICAWSTYHRPIPTDRWFINLMNKNASFIFDRYPQRANSIEEEEFPIAFSISMHKNVYQVERLLKLIYWPQNVYCIHVDKRAPHETKTAIDFLVSNFSNVFLAKSELVYWGGYGVLRAVLNCMNQTLIKFGKSHSWKYFINLSGMDFPLKTNLELVRILKILNGSNDIEFAQELQYSRYWFSYRMIKDQQGYPYTHVQDMRREKSPPPHGLKIYKGNLAATLSRPFVEYLFNNPIALDLMEWLRDTDTADEHLWATLNFNLRTQAPGGYPVECHNDTDDTPPPFITRLAIWRGSKRPCSGRFVRDVCIFGVRDSAKLARLTNHQLFTNKFYMDYQSAGFKCMEEWLEWKTRENIVRVNETFYRSMPNVIYHNAKVANTSGVCEWSGVTRKRRLPGQAVVKMVKKRER